MRVFDRAADLLKKLQSVAKRQSFLVAVRRDRIAADQFHDKVGASGLGAAAVDDASDVGMVHQCERLTLGLESGDNLLGVHSELDDFQGDASSNGLALLGHVDDTEAAFTDLFQQLVAVHGGARSFGQLHFTAELCHAPWR